VPPRLKWQATLWSQAALSISSFEGMLRQTRTYGICITASWESDTRRRHNLREFGRPDSSGAGSAGLKNTTGKAPVAAAEGKATSFKRRYRKQPIPHSFVLNILNAPPAVETHYRKRLADNHQPRLMDHHREGPASRIHTDSKSLTFGPRFAFPEA